MRVQYYGHGKSCPEEENIWLVSDGKLISVSCNFWSQRCVYQALMEPAARRHIMLECESFPRMDLFSRMGDGGDVDPSNLLIIIKEKKALYQENRNVLSK